MLLINVDHYAYCWLIVVALYIVQFNCVVLLHIYIVEICIHIIKILHHTSSKMHTKNRALSVFVGIVWSLFDVFDVRILIQNVCIYI